MKRRVLVPMLVNISGWGVTTALGVLPLYFNHAFFDALRAGHRAFPPYLLFPPLGWIIFPLIVIAVYLCHSRGGSVKECALVAFAPTILTTLYSLYLVIKHVAGGVETVGSQIALASYLRSWVNSLATPAAALAVFYFLRSRFEMKETQSFQGNLDAK